MKLLHTLMAVGLQLALGLSIGAWWAAAAAAAAYFIGREIAQAEYRWIERHGAGQRANMPALAVFRTPGIWGEKSWMWDAALPCAVVVLVAAWASAHADAVQAWVRALISV